jgi:hypothetical protein
LRVTLVWKPCQTRSMLFASGQYGA